MNIFRLFESEKFMKICSKTHQIAPFKKFIFGEACPRTLLANAWLRHASQAPKKVGPLGKFCLRPWTTTEKFT